MPAISVAAIIWISVRSLLRLLICGLSGFIVTKAGLFPPLAARSTGLLVLNIAFPCLMFSRILPAFDSSNIHVLGPLVLLAIIYEIIGMSIAWVTKQIFWVPHRFRYGLLAAGGWANVGDIPTSVLLSLTSFAPFNSNTDPNLSIAYISPFILIFTLSLFPCGGYKLIARDFVGPDVDSSEIRKSFSFSKRRHPDTEKHETEAEPSPTNENDTVRPESSSPLPLRTLHAARTFILSLLNPPSFSILIAFPIALIPTLKALFLQLPSAHIPNAPDNLPPLSFILDASQFIGAASVPLGLICLGSALARLPLPRQGEWHSLPLGAIISLAIGKLVIMPVLGTLIVAGMAAHGLIDRQDKVLMLVCLFLSCLPTATTQVYLTQIYSGTGMAEHLAAFLIPQYILMLGTMTAFVAYTLHSLFA
ncbi:hypothetical protein AX14_006698 [Amanita brunnescens Koide BX004]|nr:hypothetical protein AX14_006698 [Amanita brunnescens Koide BX004]